MTDWLPQNLQIKNLMASCALALPSGALSGVEEDVIESDTKAKTHYLLARVRKEEPEDKGRDAKAG
jgi:hypothetical protein